MFDVTLGMILMGVNSESLLCLKHQLCCTDSMAFLGDVWLYCPAAHGCGMNTKRMNACAKLILSTRLDRGLIAQGSAAWDMHASWHDAAFAIT